jgi:hypothetical protein
VPMTKSLDRLFHARATVGVRNQNGFKCSLRGSDEQRDLDIARFNHAVL